jgi:DNA-directed RNA polymerase subunit H (RpoH/RPB5)
MKRSIICAALSLTFAVSAIAGEEDASLQSQIATRAYLNKSGVIVGVSEQGTDAASTAWLVSSQMQQNPSYSPMLVVLQDDARVEILKSLKLSAAQLPALIYYDKAGRETMRVVGALPYKYKSTNWSQAPTMSNVLN